MVLWRAVGINYVRYSQIASHVTRKCTHFGIFTLPIPAKCLATVLWYCTPLLTYVFLSPNCFDGSHRNFIVMRRPATRFSSRSKSSEANS
ncbi:unnamed protein product [Heligmosomoides polygyrus]|uniref:Mitochondrial pyruvate carrier n=1 Tax=Heligmosomoides polygyrus TaxID=6339 RepID=A0A183FH71_HELPZ|nr:unnamed protein product [Heligmosomoides polygyrus]